MIAPWSETTPQKIFLQNIILRNYKISLTLTNWNCFTNTFATQILMFYQKGIHSKVRIKRVAPQNSSCQKVPIFIMKVNVTATFQTLGNFTLLFRIPSSKDHKYFATSGYSGTCNVGGFRRQGIY